MNSNKDTNETKEIKAEIHIEVTGEDKPSKCAIKHARWATRAKWSLLAVIVSLIYTIIVGIEVSSFVFFGVSVFVLFFSWAKALSAASEEYRSNNDSIIYCDTPMFPDSSDSE